MGISPIMTAVFSGGGGEGVEMGRTGSYERLASWGYVPFEIGQPAPDYYYFFYKNELSRGIASHICGMPPVFIRFLRVH